MDELELLKKDWQKRESDYPKLSYNDIYKMILKRSSSIVKWIFIISVLEFGFGALISFSLKDIKFSENFKDLNKDLNMDSILISLGIICYCILIYFFYLFYKNYKNISSTDTTKQLMEAILKTRRTVKQYVAFNLIFVVIATFIGVFYVLKNDENMLVQEAIANGETLKFYVVTIILTILLLAIAVGVLLLFYWLVYGLLLKQLKKNYKELKKMEV